MVAVAEAVLVAAGGGGATILAQWGVAWLKSRGEQHKVERDADVKLEEHRDGLTFDLLRAAREEMGELRKEVVDLRGLTAKAAHIEEALDHLHALLHADGEIEMRAAARRATAFLKRMRPDPVEVRGGQRNDVQAAISAARIKRDFGVDGEET